MKQKGRKRKKIAIILAKIVFAGACLGFVASKQDWAVMKQYILSLNVLVFLACLACFVAAQAIISLRWCLLLNVQKAGIAVWAAIKLHFLGLFYNNFMPGAVGGDLLKAWYVTKHTHRRLEAVFSVFVDRLTGLVSMIMMAIAGFLILLRQGQVSILANGDSSGAKSGDLTVYIKISLVLAVILLAGLGVMLAVPITRRMLKAIVGKIIFRVERVISSFKVYLYNPKRLLQAVCITLVAQSLNILGIYLVGKNLGIEVGLKYYFVFFPIVWIASVIPVSIGGVGVVEGLLVLLFVKAGAVGEAAFALSLCQRVVIMLGALPGLGIHVFGAHLPRKIEEIE